MQNQLKPKNPSNNNDNVIPITINDYLPTCENTQPYIKDKLNIPLQNGN